MRLDVQNIQVHLAAREILKDVSMEANEGEIVGLIGPNGSGKSTLLRTVYRMLRPAHGAVRVGEDEVWALTPTETARRIGMVAQDSAQEFDFTVREIVEMGRTPHKGMFARDTGEDRTVVDRALSQVGALDLAGRSVSQLSGGERQRVMVARALAQQPRLLVLDEPINHLDVLHQLELLEFIRGLGLTTLITLHDLNLAARYCHRLYLLQAGTVVAHGPPDAVLTPTLMEQVYRVHATTRHLPHTGHLQLDFSPLSQEHA